MFLGYSRGLLNRIYRRNPKTQSYIIDIRIDHYRDLFNDLDPSPLRKRDLHQDFFAYLEESSADIPLKYPLDLHIHCSFSERLIDKEERVRQGIHTYYQFLLINTRREIFSMIRNSLGYLIIGGLFLFISFYFSRNLENSYINRILIEGTNIGGWVFVWESLALSVFKNRKLRKDTRRILRILHGGLQFHYSGEENEYAAE